MSLSATAFICSSCLPSSLLQPLPQHCSSQEPPFPACPFLLAATVLSCHQPHLHPGLLSLPFLYHFFPARSGTPIGLLCFSLPAPKVQICFQKELWKKGEAKKSEKSPCPWGWETEMQICCVGVDGDHGMSQDFLDPSRKGCLCLCGFPLLLQAQQRQCAPASVTQLLCAAKQQFKKKLRVGREAKKQKKKKTEQNQTQNLSKKGKRKKLTQAMLPGLLLSGEQQEAWAA